MVTARFVALVILLISFAAAASGDSRPALLTGDQVCNPSGVVFRYTGIRLYSAMIYGWPVRRFWYVVRCSAGEIASQQYFPANRTAHFSFGQPLKISYAEGYIFSRRKKYSNRNALVFHPYADVGAVYRCDVATGNPSLFAPLRADNPARSFSEAGPFGKTTKYTPLLFTQEEEPKKDWEQRQEVSAFESYIYSEADLQSTWFKTNELINGLDNSLVAGTDYLVFWEFDGLEHELEGVDWRSFVNKLVPGI